MEKIKPGLSQGSLTQVTRRNIDHQAWIIQNVPSGQTSNNVSCHLFLLHDAASAAAPLRDQDQEEDCPHQPHTAPEAQHSACSSKVMLLDPIVPKTDESLTQYRYHLPDWPLLRLLTQPRPQGHGPAPRASRLLSRDGGAPGGCREREGSQGGSEGPRLRGFL